MFGRQDNQVTQDNQVGQDTDQTINDQVTALSTTAPTAVPSDPQPGTAFGDSSFGNSNPAPAEGDDVPGQTTPPADLTAPSLDMTPLAGDVSATAPETSPTESTPPSLSDESEPSPEQSLPPVIAPSADDNATTPTDTATSTPAAVNSDTLIDIKQHALQELSPLIGHLEQTPEEKFRTTMMMIQASDNQSLIQSAYDAAQSIADEKVRAQALLDIVNEINYFTQHSTAE